MDTNLLVSTNKMDTQVVTVDPYLPHYIYEKATNPKADLVWKSFEKKCVQDVDRIVELAHGNRESVTSPKDWEIVQELLKFYANRFPDEFNEFRRTIPDIRQTRNQGGYSKSKEIMYVGAIPPRFMRMIRAIFPAQRFDKKFVWKLVRKVPLFKVGGE